MGNHLFQVDPGFGIPYVYVIAPDIHEAVQLAARKWPAWRTVTRCNADVWLNGELVAEHVPNEQLFVDGGPSVARG